MGIVEIVSGAILIAVSVIVIIVTLLQESKDRHMSAINGSAGESFFEKNSARSREAKLSRITTVLTIIFFVVTLALNILPIFVGKE
jgi:preprotein translocase subunit SecG